MIHPDTELRHVNDIIGLGVFATKLIPKGTITWVRDQFDQAFSLEQVAAMAPPYQAILEKYGFTDGKGHVVLCWDHSRFFNHSCDANCLSAGYDFELAVRDIHPGEQLTDDYGTLNLGKPFACACQLPSCRQWILPDDLPSNAERWDFLVRAAFPLIQQVSQPLWPLLEEKAEVEAALKHPAQLRSILSHYSKA